MIIFTGIIVLTSVIFSYLVVAGRLNQIRTKCPDCGKEAIEVNAQFSEDKIVFECTNCGKIFEKEI